jgi:hypothetical protein
MTIRPRLTKSGELRFEVVVRAGNSNNHSVTIGTYGKLADARWVNDYCKWSLEFDRQILHEREEANG